MSETRELERQLQQTFRAKAGQVDVAEARFDAADRLTEASVAGKRSRRAVIAVATALVIAAAAAGVVLITRPDSRGPSLATRSSAGATSPTTAPAPAPIPIAAPLLAPTFMPDGQKLWSLTSAAQADTQLAGQLFGSVAADGTLAPGMLVELQAASPGDGVGDGTPVTVRGRSGVTRASKDAGDSPFEINWIEGDADVRVTVRGATVPQAVAALDALQPRATSLRQGFDPASAPDGYALLGEHLTASTTGVAATFQYSAATPTAGARPDFTIRTDLTAGYPGYARIWIAGHRAADGAVVEFDPGVGLFFAPVDGGQVVVESSAAHPDLALLEKIARSARPLEKAPTAVLATDAQARVALELPVFGSAPLPTGEIQLYGTGTPTAVCLQLLGASVACSDPFTVTAGPSGAGSNGALPGYAGSAVISGKWYVFVATNAAPSITKNGMPDTALTTQTAQIGAFHIALAVVPEGVEHVQVWVPTSENQSSGTGFNRPS